jgi:hypothetical protein
VPLLDGTRTAPLAAGLLYQLSIESEARTAFCCSPGGLNRLLDSILRALGAPSSAGEVVMGLLLGFTVKALDGQCTQAITTMARCSGGQVSRTVQYNTAQCRTVQCSTV